MTMANWYGTTPDAPARIRNASAKSRRLAAEAVAIADNVVEFAERESSSWVSDLKKVSR